MEDLSTDNSHANLVIFLTYTISKSRKLFKNGLFISENWLLVEKKPVLIGTGF